MNHRTILIVGGGIGGLSAALCLAAKGWRVELFEQAEEFAEIGAGIQLSPNCTRVLHSVGLSESLARTGFLPQAGQMRQWQTGEVLSESPLGTPVAERFGAPYYHMHRADLMELLAAAARQSDLITLHTGVRVTDIRQDEPSATITVGEQTWSGDALIGADGIHSHVRAHLWGEQSPRFTGCIAWRALVPVERLPPGLVRPMSTAWLGPGKHFVHYYVRSGTLVNCVCVVDKEGWEIESWTERGDYAELKQDFQDWHGDIQTLLDAADPDALFKWALFDREPMDQWGKGRISLLGDACHPTLPFMAQGAAMAIEDGAVLAGALEAIGEIAPALAHYENLRRERTAGVQNGSRSNARTFHLNDREAEERNQGLRTARSGAMGHLFSYDALNAARAPSDTAGND